MAGKSLAAVRSPDAIMRCDAKMCPRLHVCSVSRKIERYTLRGVHPGKPLPDELIVDQGIPHLNEGHRPAAAVHCHRLDLHHLGEDEDGRHVLRLGPEVLLRAVDAPQADLLLPAVVKHGDTVAVDDAAMRFEVTSKV